MTPSEFVRKWAASMRTERAASQEHFIDICRMLGEKTPNDADPSGDFYAFEKGVEKTGGEDGYADVWLNKHFGWEYKGKRKDLREAYKQLVDYHEALGNPPLLVVCDLDRFEVHTKWTNKESWVYKFALADLMREEPVTVETAAATTPRNAPTLSAVQVLKALFEDTRKLEPDVTTDDITKEAAALFEKIAAPLRGWTEGPQKERVYDDMRIARFATKLLFCLFASDVGLLPKFAFSDPIKSQKGTPAVFRETLARLFRAMDSGDRFGPEPLLRFNGSLFEDADVPEHFGAQEIAELEKLDRLNWSDVEPAIFGTLFERILDPGTRAKLGAHYTSREDIEVLAEPVLMSPFRREWEVVREAAIAAMEKARLAGGRPETQRERLRETVEPFLEKLAGTRVLDPACGSGNFLYVSLALMKSLEKEVLAFAALHGVDLAPRVHPKQLYGIEINPYAHELASVVIWIGYLQWKFKNGIDPAKEEPILQKLEQIHLMDAILDLSDPAHPKEPEWPEAEVIIGNPPFLGGKRLRRELGDEYVDALFRLWDGRVKRESDLCCYFFEKARGAIEAKRLKRAGLLATQAIRGGANRETLKRIKESGDIFFAVDDREWVLDGAAVQVAMVGFDDGSETQRVLLEHYETREKGADGKARRSKVSFREHAVEGINPDLTSKVDASTARRLSENAGISFFGATVIGPFDITDEAGRAMLSQPNPNGRSNGEVLRRWANGSDITGRNRLKWIIDFGNRTEEDAALFEAPFEYVKRHIKFRRESNRRAHRRIQWWLHGEYAPNMRAAIARHRRYIITPRVSKHRLFAWLPSETLPDSATVIFGRDDDYFFGVLQSHTHEVWALHVGTQLESRPRYTPTTCFETFPLPWPPGKEPWGDPKVEAIGEAARELNELRERWLNPASGERRAESEERADATSPHPPAPSPDRAGEGEIDGLGLSESELKKRTLTNLYNERPTWLVNAHRKLDEAVFAAYGWRVDLEDGEILSRLLAENLRRSGAGE